MFKTVIEYRFSILACLVTIVMSLGLIRCRQKDAPAAGVTPGRVFQTSFESVNDFSGFYITPQNTTNSNHDLSTEQVHSGTYSHKGWILGSNPPSTATVNNNHRAYPTVQLFKTASGAFKTPALIEFWVWLDMTFQSGEWFSFATIDHTTGDVWDPVLVNLSDQGIVHLMHVPSNGQAVYKFQTSTIFFPMRTWVKISIEIHFDSSNGYAKAWQNDELVSWAELNRGSGEFTQAHFGIYAPPSMTTGTAFNDDLTIKELTTK
jgi:hypothetical protein